MTVDARLFVEHCMYVLHRISLWCESGEMNKDKLQLTNRTYIIHNHKHKCPNTIMGHLPMCQSEFGPATLYGRRTVSPPGQRRAALRGSTLLKELLTCSRVT